MFRSFVTGLCTNGYNVQTKSKLQISIFYVIVTPDRFIFFLQLQSGKKLNILGVEDLMMFVPYQLVPNTVTYSSLNSLIFPL